RQGGADQSEGRRRYPAPAPIAARRRERHRARRRARPSYTLPLWGRAGWGIIGRVTSGGYGYTIDRSIAYAYLPSAQAAPGTSAQVQVFGRWVPATVAREPLYDPAGERIRS